MVCLQVRYLVGLCLDQGSQPGVSHVCRLSRIPAGCQGLLGPVQAFQRCHETTDGSSGTVCGACSASTGGWAACLPLHSRRPGVMRLSWCPVLASALRNSRSRCATKKCPIPTRKPLVLTARSHLFKMRTGCKCAL